MKYLIEKVSGYFPLYTTLFLSLKSQTFIQANAPPKGGIRICISNSNHNNNQTATNHENK